MSFFSRFRPPLLWPVALATFTVPLAFFLTSAKVAGEGTRYFKALPFVIDFFTLAKVHTLLFCAGAGLILFVFHIAKYRPSPKVFVPLWPLAIVISLALVSAFLATENWHILLWGLPELWDGLLVWLGYIVLALCAFTLTHQNPHQSNTLMGVAAAGFIPLFFIGFAQYFGFVFLEEPWIQRFFSNISGVSYQLSFTQGWVTSTLYNPNIVGSYVALLAPVALAIAITTSSKTKSTTSWTWFSALLAMGMGSQSRAGFIGTAFACLLLLLCFAGRKILRKQHTPALALSLVPSFLILSSPTHHIRDDFLRTGPHGWLLDATSKLREVRSLRVEGNTFFLDEGACSLALTPPQSGGVWSVLDANQQGIPFSFLGTPTNGEIKLLDASCAAWRITTFQMGTDFFASIFDGVTTLDVGFPSVGARIVFQGSLMKPRTPITALPWLSDGFASYRGYIWRRTIPLILEKTLWGHALGTFPATFPQDDMAGKMVALGSTLLTDKPHSLYLGIAYAMGIPALLFFVGWLGILLTKSWQAWKKCTAPQAGIPPNTHTHTILAFSCGILGYLIAGFFNDPNVAVAPLFFIMLGMLASLLSHARRQN